MPDLAIRVENLSKLYCIGQQERYLASRDVLARSLSVPFRRMKEIAKFKFRNSKSDYIWALKDVSFEIRQGEVVGIPSATLGAGISRNGAGKARMAESESGSVGDPFLPFTPAPVHRFSIGCITKPMEGYAEIRGREVVRALRSRRDL